MSVPYIDLNKQYQSIKAELDHAIVDTIDRSDFVAGASVSGFENEFRMMSRGEAIVTQSYRELPLPVRIPLFDKVYERDKHKYKEKRAKKTEQHRL